MSVTVSVYWRNGTPILKRKRGEKKCTCGTRAKRIHVCEEKGEKKVISTTFKAKKAIKF